jgi:hypothetical protein
MRSSSAAEREEYYKTIIDDHPWYNEFLFKVVNMGGNKTALSKNEEILVDQIRG